MQKHLKDVTMGAVTTVTAITTGCTDSSSGSGSADGVKIVTKDEVQISADFPFEPKYVEVLGSRMQYVDEGKGDPILFLHGNPTSSYLWRNIIPYVSDDARVLAVDLIGMGKSDKPDIDYSFADHAKHLHVFIEKLDLKNIALVVHDWGSGLGFNYAATHESNIKGIAFMESLIKPFTWETMPAEGAAMIRKIKTPGVGEEMVMNKNFFIEKFLPSAIIRPLSEQEMNSYRAPYPTAESRKPVWKWPTEIPVSGEPRNVHNIVVNYQQWLQNTTVPKILLHATPGIMIKDAEVEWVKQNMKNVDVVHVGKGLHFIQEDNPDAIGSSLSDWYQKIADYP